MHEENRNIITTELGLLIDADTGEVVGDTQTKSEFVVNSPDSLEWALKRRLQITTTIAAKQQFYDTIEIQGKKEVKRLENQLTWWDHRFAADIEHYIRQQLEGKKERYISTPYGEATLRHTNFKVEVRDKPNATEWLVHNHPETIKQVPTIDMAALKHCAEDYEPLPVDLFKITEPGEKFDVRLPSPLSPTGQKKED